MPQVEFSPSLKQWTAYQYLTDQTTEVVFYGGAAGGGKSYLGVWWIILMAMSCPDTAWGIGRNQITTLMKTTYLTLIKVLSFIGISAKFDGQLNVMTFSNGSQIFLIDMIYRPSDPLYTRFGGLELTGGMVDEAGECDKVAINVYRSRLGRRNNDKYGIHPTLLLTCNPTKNWIYTEVWKNINNLPDNMKFVIATIKDNPTAEARVYEKQLESIDDYATKQRLLYGNWDYEDTNLGLMTYSEILTIFENDHIKPTGQRYLSCDVAAMGSDKAVVIAWGGLVVIEIKTLALNDGPALVEMIRDMQTRHRVPTAHICYDSDGVGSYLKGYIRGAYAITNNAKPLTKENYANLKSQLAFRLATLVKEGQIYVRCQEHKQTIIDELEQLRKVKEDMDKIGLEKKEEVKKRLGRSPDFADAFIYRMVFEIKTPIKQSHFSWA